jgi:acyl dehydratase
MAEDLMFTKITDEKIATLRSRIGVLGPMRPATDPYTRYQVIKYLACVGDDNPLYWDEEYATKTRWKGVVVPPRMLLHSSGERTPRSVTEPMDPSRITFMGEDVMAGTFPMISGTRLVFERPIRLGDQLRAQSAPFDVIERKSSMAGRSLQLINKTVFLNQRDEVVTTEYMSVFRMDRGAARDNAKYLNLPEASYTDEEMEQLDAQYELERTQRRGDVPRYWDDTEVGEELITLAKGPLTVTDIASYFMGHGSAYFTNRVKHLELKANPSARLVNPSSNIEDDVVAAHWDPYFGPVSGIPRPYDEGPMRYDNLAHLVSDWMGDDAEMRELAVELRAPVLFGDVSWCTGKVVGKRVDADRHLVDLDLWITNQRGERSTLGSAIVELPYRK